jgi:putative flavoprotein involved in K+ transport
MKDGRTIAADLVVLATRYKKQEELERKLFGEADEQRVGPN